MKKESFCSLMGIIKDLDKSCDEFLKFISLERMESFFKIKDGLVKALEQEFGLEGEKYNAIIFFIYESAFGKQNTEVFDSDTGEVIADLNNTEALYEYLSGLSDSKTGEEI